MDAPGVPLPCGSWNGIFHFEGGSGNTREANNLNKSLFFCKNLMVIAADRSPLQQWGLRKSWKPSQSWLTGGVITESSSPHPASAAGNSWVFTDLGWDEEEVGEKQIVWSWFLKWLEISWRVFFVITILRLSIQSNSWQDLGNQKLLKIFYWSFQDVSGEGRVIASAWNPLEQNCFGCPWQARDREQPEKPLGISLITDTTD